MSIELAVFGLGNPGPDYEGTRHNAGTDVVRKLAARFGRKSPIHKHRSLILSVRIGATPVLLVQPLTYMNRSGESARAISHAYGLPTDKLWVVVDDFQIPLGSLRIRVKGSDGGHNGLTSIIEALGTPEFPRFRLGIGMPPEGVSTIDYVLGRFTSEERATMDRLTDYAAVSIELAVREGLARAMSRFNGSVLPEEDNGSQDTDRHRF